MAVRDQRQGRFTSQIRSYRFIRPHPLTSRVLVPGEATLIASSVHGSSVCASTAADTMGCHWQRKRVVHTSEYSRMRPQPRASIALWLSGTISICARSHCKSCALMRRSRSISLAFAVGKVPCLRGQPVSANASAKKANTVSERSFVTSALVISMKVTHSAVPLGTRT